MRKRLLPYRILAGVFLLAAAVFVGISLGGMSPHDPQPLPQYPVNDEPGNPCGLVGAYVSAYLLYMHGLGAFLVPVFLAMAGIYAMTTRDGFWRALGRAAGIFVVLAAASYLVGIMMWAGLPGRLGWMTPLSPGGVWGLVPVKIAHDYLGVIGGVFAGLLTLLCGFFLVSQLGTAWTLARMGHATIWSGRALWSVLCAAPSLLGRLRRGKAGAAYTSGPVSAIDEAPADIGSPVGKVEVGKDEEREDAEDEQEGGVEFEPTRGRGRSAHRASPDKKRERRPAKPPPVQFRLPPLALLEDGFEQEGDSPELLVERGEVIVATLAQYGVPARLVTYHQGPAVTLFEVQLEEGVRLSKVEGLSGDLAMRLRAPTQRLRIMAPIPGRGTVGIEVPNQKNRLVYLKPLLETPEFRLIREKCQLPLVYGKDLLARPVTADLADLPHLLIAGTTGSGKSVCINALIVSLVMQMTPEELRFILIDPKQIEMSHYTRLPHLLTPVVTDIKRAVKALEWATIEMEQRYTLFHGVGARNVAEYNQIPYEQRLARAGVAPGDEEGAGEYPEKMPYVIIVVDEFADLILQSRRDVENYVQRLAQKARAAGIHLVFATQRPSADVFKGVIKANFPAVIAFHVSSAVNSRVVLDELGAEALLGKGDMLFRSPEFRKPVRAKGAFLSDDEIDRVVVFWSNQASPEFSEAVEAVMSREEEEAQAAAALPLGAQDDRFDEAVQFVMDTSRASASSLQAGLGIGYARANKIITAMEELGIVGEQRGVKYREILMGYDEWDAKKERLLSGGVERQEAVAPAPVSGEFEAVEEEEDTEAEDEKGDDIEVDEVAIEDVEAEYEDEGEEDDPDGEEETEDDEMTEEQLNELEAGTADGPDEDDENKVVDKSGGERNSTKPSSNGRIVRGDGDTTEFEFPSLPED